ncbi:hypothetical protein LCFBJUUZ_CDS0109 [Staphylococcus phage PG-2021_76]
MNLENIEFGYTHKGMQIEDNWKHELYTVEITHNDVTEYFDWKQGLGIQEEPTLENVLECLILDLNYYEEDIYSLYEDEEQAEKIIKALKKQNKKMNYLFTEEEQAQLYDLFN